MIGSSDNIYHRYSISAIAILTEGEKLILKSNNIMDKYTVLKKLEQWYKNTSPSGVADEFIPYWKDCVNDIETIKLNTKVKY